MNEINNKHDDFPLKNFISDSLNIVEELNSEMVSSQGFNVRIADKIEEGFNIIKNRAAEFDLNVVVEITENAGIPVNIFKTEFIEASYNKDFLKLYRLTLQFLVKVLKAIDEDGDDRRYEKESYDVRAEFAEFITFISKRRSEDVKGNKREKEKREIDGDNADIEELPDAVDLTDEIMKTFISESIETVEKVALNLLTLIKQPEILPPLEESYRLIHSFKGNCGILPCRDLEELLHEVESVFMSITEGKRKSSSQIFERLLEVLDVLKFTVENFNETEGKIINLGNVISGISEDIRQEEKEKTSKIIPEESDYTDLDIKFYTKFTGVRNNIRVDTKKLDALSDLIGELVTAKTMVYDCVKDQLESDKRIEKSIRFLNRVALDLQDVNMDIRLIPLEGLFRKLMRLVHEISIKSGKAIDFECYGGATELDKGIIEKISDPLVHIIRNASDHGIETREERLIKGKPENSRIIIWARHMGGEVWIVVSDNGRGLDREKILKRAKELNLISEDRVKLSDQEVKRIILSPGFSTAEKITDVSGRGMGMDIVVDELRRLKGSLDIKSKDWYGTTVTLKIPLTLAILDGMLVKVGKSFYTLPIDNIKGTFQFNEKDIFTIGQEEKYIRLRDETLLLVHLNDIYKNRLCERDLKDGILVILEENNTRIGLIVDKIVGKYESVIKPLPIYFKRNIRGLSGCSILGDGRISLILDPGSLVDIAISTDMETEKVA